MSTSANPLSPRLIKGGIVTMDPDTSVVLSVIPCSTTRRQSRARCRYSPLRVLRRNTRRMLRLRGPAIETIKVEVEMDAIDQLEFPTQFPLAVKYGLHPQIAQLEMLVNPTVETLLGG